MRILIALAALPLLVAAAPPPPSAVATACRPPVDTVARRKAERPQKLGDLPSGRPWRAVYRLENGCPTPVALGPARP